MSDPLFALLIFFAVVALAAAVLWPASGVLARLKRLARLTERVRMEDVLKQLYKLEYDRLPATTESVAGGVQIPQSHAVRLLQRLEEKSLVSGAGERFRLTDAGRAQALHIVRTHRLWERFLADRTGTAPEEWHEQAEEREHLISASEADDLAAALGHPVYDPHGDPIPTASGDMPVRTGIPLTSLEPGERGLITHLEDEPEEIYRELVGLGLGLMAPVERLKGEAGRVHFRTGGAGATRYPARWRATSPWSLPPTWPIRDGPGRWLTCRRESRRRWPRSRRCAGVRPGAAFSIWGWCPGPRCMPGCRAPRATPLRTTSGGR